MANRTKLTKSKKREFLKEVQRDANISRVCRLFGISRMIVYEHRDNDPEFGKKLEESVQIGIDNHIDECRRRAFEGCDEPIVYQGEITGSKKVYSDTLAMFLIKKERPEYRDKFIDIPTGSNFHLTMDFGKPEDKE